VTPARWITVILAVFMLLALLYSVATPIFEASDEVSHYAVAQHIADTGELPVQQQGVKTAWEQEGSQPPLYYLLVSPLARLIDTRDAAERMVRNPHAAPGDPSLDANRNLIVHSPAEDFPWRNTTLAVHLIRFVSILMGAGTIGLSYLIARRIFPDPRTRSVAIGAAALIAFNPMFIFIAASVNNDNLTILLTSLALYLGVLCWYEPPGRVDRSGWVRRLLLGIVLGAAALSKISGLTLLPVIALMLTVRHLRVRDWRGWILSGLLIALPVLLVAGWWYARNVQLYGELFGLDTMVAIAGPRSMSLLNLVPEFDGFRYSYWALFGAVNIVTFPLAYVIFDLFTLISVIGCMIWFVRYRRSDRFALMLILAAYVLLVFMGVMRWTMMTPASQGRLMFPAISAISLLLWLGWETILNSRLRSFDFSKLRWSMPIFMLLVAVVVPFRDIAPTYAGPAMIAEAQLPSDLRRLEMDYGDQLRLIGYRVAEPLARTDSVEFTLYWQCLQPMAADYSIFAIVYGRQLQELGKRDAYPYHGLYATRQCQPGQIFADPYRIPIKAAEAMRPALLRTQIGVKDWLRLDELKPARDGQALPALIISTGQLTSTGLQSTPDVEARYRLGEAIELLGYDAPRIDREQRLLTYRLYWHVLQSMPEDYTVFAHLLAADGTPLGQGDSLPFAGDYPTSAWQPGEVFVEERSLPLDDEAADRAAILALGLYRLSDGARLPVIDALAQRQPDDQIIAPILPAR
jgi:hypothetical protein